ncbi:MAG: nucleotidyltransferase family protein [Rhodobacteraceae bacterium]|nr:nucleotidyltransferase family protein [Paracoccaceae bacterium]
MTHLNVDVLLLAAGASTRMRGKDKLLEPIDGQLLLHRSAKILSNSNAQIIHVILPPDHQPRLDAIAGLTVQTVESPCWQEGMAASIRAGMRAISRNCNAVIIALADMPDVSSDHINRLISAFNPVEKHEICRAVAENGVRGHPVLLGRRFFPQLAALTGDRGAKSILAAAPDYIIDVQTTGQAALIDLDTPEDWAAWRQPK